MSWLPETIQERLVIVLAHFVWQGTAVAVVLAALVAVLNIKRPSVRYASSLLAFLLMSVCPVVTWFVVLDFGVRGVSPALDQPREQLAISASADPSNHGVRWPDTALHSSREPRSNVSDVDIETDGGRRPAAALQGDVSETSWLDRFRMYQPWIIGVWLCGVGVLSLRLLLGAIGIWRWRRAVEVLPDTIAPTIERLCATLSMQQPRVRICRRVAEAVAVGLFKPMILLPAAWVTELPADMLEAVLAHELAHVRRLDLWVNLLQRIVETLLFYHPAVWWLSRRLRIERELCCDDLAVTATNNRLRYAETLEYVARLSCAGRGSPDPALAVAISSREGVLLHRVRQLLGVTPPSRTGSAWLAGLLTLGIVLTIALGTFVSSRAETEPPLAERDFSGGRGSPDPALDSTVRLSNSEGETNKASDANGDLRSNPAAASGDPRRAQETIEKGNAQKRVTVIALDGYVLSIDQRRGVAVIGLGLDDAVQKLMKFEVRAKALANGKAGVPVVKGRVEVTRIIDQNTSEVRILNENAANKIAKGDTVVAVSLPSNIERDHQKVVDALDQVGSYEFADTPLHKVLDFFRRDWPNVAIQVDPLPEAAMQTRITFQTKGDEFEYVLAAALDQAKLSYCVHSVWLVVGTADEIRGRGYAVPESFSELITKLKQAEDGIRWERILRGTVEAADLASLPKVLKLLEHTEPVVQREALRVLLRFGGRASSAQAAALKLTAAKDRGVRRVAWRAFAATGLNDPKTLPCIAQAWNSGDREVRDDLFELVALFGNHEAQMRTTYEHITPELRQHLMWTIGDPDESQRDLVMLGLKDGQPAMRAAALKHGLQNARYSEPIIRQLQLMLKDADPLCRVLAAGHLLKLADSYSPALTLLIAEGSKDNVPDEVNLAALSAFQWLSLEIGQKVSQSLEETRRTATSEKTKQFCRRAMTIIARHRMQTEHNRTGNSVKDIDAEEKALRGQIRWVDRSNALAWINLGEADSVKKRMKFEVHAKAPADGKAGAPVVKGTVEVTRIIDAHTSEVRILTEEPGFGLAKNDDVVCVYSPPDKPPDKQKANALDWLLAEQLGKAPPVRSYYYDANKPRDAARIKPTTSLGRTSPVFNGGSRRSQETHTER